MNRFEPSEQARKSNLESNGGSTNGRIAEDVIIINHARSNISSNSSSSTSTNNLGKSLGNNSNGEVRKARYFVVDGVDALSKFGGIEEAWLVDFAPSVCLFSKWGVLDY